MKPDVLGSDRTSVSLGINTPLIGSWIETKRPRQHRHPTSCINTPLIGSWIETVLSGLWQMVTVGINTPLIGSWIETFICVSPSLFSDV